MLSIWKIEDGACYINEDTKKKVVWEMLYYSSKMFWGCGIIKELDKVKVLSDKAFGDEPTAIPELFDLLQSIESPLLDTIRITICFENYFKAMLLLEGYVIHRINHNLCREKFPQFLRQRSTPVMLSDIKQAEKWHNSSEPFQSLDIQTLQFSALLKQPKYRAIYSKGEKTDNKLFPLLQNLNNTRNSLHFLNIEYIASGGLGVDNFVFLRDYVQKYIEDYGEKFYKENKSSIETGTMIIETLDPEGYYEES